MQSLTHDAEEALVSRETSTASASATAQARVQSAYLVAMKRPRSIDDVRERLLKECRRLGFAEAAMYSIPVGGGKTVTDLSIRFAEAAHRVMGNMEVTTQIVYEDDLQQVWRVCAQDYETNASEVEDVSVPKFVERREVRDGDELLSARKTSVGNVVYRIKATGRNLEVAAKSACRKAKRRVVLSLVPADILDECKDQVVKTQRAGIAADPDMARKALVRSFGEIGVRAVDLRDYLGHDLEGCSPVEIEELRAVYSTIRDGEATWRDVLGTKEGGESSADKQSAQLRAKIQERASKQAGRRKRSPRQEQPTEAQAPQVVAPVAATRDAQPEQMSIASLMSSNGALRQGEQP